ncbi:hypothetical protein ACIG56_34580 [Nocardia fusca]|uniref:hypothetical protein n=1 Tax=Nocardia fusca TaxID=941183 RepID=UPI0037C9EB78
MMPNIVKGSDMGGLLRYLAGPGRANEHTNPTVLAGDLVTMAVYAGRIDVARASELAELLDSPRRTVLRGEPVLVTNYRKAHALIAEGTPRKEAFAWEKAVWYGGGQLSKDLTLSALRDWPDGNRARKPTRLHWSSGASPRRPAAAARCDPRRWMSSQRSTSWRAGRRRCARSP